MDPSIGWYQPEQQGPAKELWAKIYYVCQQVNSLNMNEKNADKTSSNADYISLSEETNSRKCYKSKCNVNDNGYYNRTKRKRENLASTYDLNENKQWLVGEFGGCPWKRKHFRYDRGIVG